LGVLAALVGSYQLDLPTGYAIIFMTVISTLFFVIFSTLRAVH
jgi:ABC-type Mn2+/Zn2+ transport system permease subunit